ncbi:EF-hand domain-containing family member [Trichinella pseudospiralis]
MGKCYKRKRKFNNKSHGNKKVPERKAVDFSEQEVPRSCRELMTLNHRKLYKKNKKFPKQRFIQNKNEDDVEFLRRVNQVTHTLLEEEMFKIKFGIDDAKHTCKRSIQQNSGHAKRKINQHGAESSLLNRRRRRRSRRKDTTFQCDD